ncbi:hypothetical protein M9H77_31189 [Catharanthus roseus]|uniref:Uncharacterized protein n=1 Tax=Catharanthus roseus TaxID=4058 RepID=A0ACC0A209_CATRO|nr:hypothetical protein M9H77_31189 [Catharanthus roseus]
MSISHLVADDPEIPVSNIIQEVQILYQTGCTYKRACIMTTNISEALNSVLKKARVLPLKALVELIFNKLVKYFHQHREEAKNYVHPSPTRIFDKFLLIELKSREHKVTTYNRKREYTWSNLQSEFLCVEKMGQEQMLMYRRYIHNKRTEKLTKRIFIRS